VCVGVWVCVCVCVSVKERDGGGRRKGRGRGREAGRFCNTKWLMTIVWLIVMKQN